MENTRTPDDPPAGARLDADAARRVAALITAGLHAPPEPDQRRADPVLRAAYGDALSRATACLPLLVHLVNTLLRDLADALGVAAADLWQQRAIGAAALYDEGGPRG
ncbi:hypothetical protein [Streptomyces sp. PAM3C]|uniref:hypothetical protein n=1 Tax=Streptomyces sp. PAM3C TaxID=2847300 RepID=UPI001C1E37F9|nr:hypothetical protein [Streptomyces sp. PAM3C]MBU5944911.1 hypothetical protein [Streptomyces sp. PAM3C]